MPSKAAERNEEIRRRRAAGETINALAQRYGLSRPRITNICVGIFNRGARVASQNQTRNAELRRRYAEGEDADALAREYGMTLPRVYQVCRLLRPCLAGSEGSRPKEDRNAEIRRRLRGGERQAALAQEYGVSCARISQIAAGPKASEGDALADRIQREYLPSGDAADYLGLRRDTLHEYTEAGKFPGVARPGKKRIVTLYPIAALDAYRARADQTKAKRKPGAR